VFLINRITTAVLTESTQILWQGAYTQQYEKTIGIKQGCPFSPDLFIILLDACVQKTKFDLLAKGIKLMTGSSKENELTLPLIIGYADDLYIISHDLKIGKEVLEALLLNLRPYGLEINPEKSGILIKKRATGDQQALPPLKVLEYDIPVVSSLKVLGTTINSHMERKSAIKNRLNTTMRVYKSILQYLKKLKAPIDLLVKLYEIIIVNAMIYGLNCSSMTKQNQKSLMHREIIILKELASIAYPKPTQITIAKLLNNRTINRKVSIGRIRFYNHVRRGDRNTLTFKSLNYRVMGRRKLGRPLFTFNDTLVKDIEKFRALGIGDEDWEDIYPFRDTVKRVTAQLLRQTDLSDDPLPEELNLYNEYELMQMQEELNIIQEQ
jgi:hypothetical protein